MIFFDYFYITIKNRLSYNTDRFLRLMTMPLFIKYPENPFYFSLKLWLSIPILFLCGVSRSEVIPEISLQIGQDRVVVTTYQWINTTNLGKSSSSILSDINSIAWLRGINIPFQLNKYENSHVLRFNLKSEASRDYEWILSFDGWSYVDFYFKEPDQQEFLSKKAGILVPFRERDYPRGNNAFIRLNVMKNQYLECVVFLRQDYSKTDFPPLNLNFKVSDIEHADAYESKLRQYNSAFIGIFLVMFLFNLVVYFSIRDIKYLYYLVILVMFMLLTADVSGYNVSILKGWKSFPAYKHYVNIFVVTLISFFSVIFCQHFLTIKSRYPRWNTFFKFLMALFSVCFLLQWYDFKLGTDVSNVVSLLFIFSIFIVIFQSTIAGYPSAIYLLVAMVFTITGSVIAILAQLKVIPETDFTMRYALPLGSCMEMVLFSFALGNRINILRKENEENQQKIINQLKYQDQLQTQANQELEQKVLDRTKEISIQKDIILTEKEKSEKLLLNILPKSTSEELIKTGKATPRYYDSATVMFTDYVLFTSIAEKLSPIELVDNLDYCFGTFDDIIKKYGLEKIKTIGDAYMCVGGVPIPDENHAVNTVLAGLEIQEFMQNWKKQKIAMQQTPFELRVGIHSGPLTAGVVGKQKFAFDIWGSTVNLASRLEAGGAPDRVNISGATYELVKNNFECEYRGNIAIKNKGQIDMYFVNNAIFPSSVGEILSQNKI